MSAFLPQNDPDRARRDADLAKIRGNYQYNHSYMSPLAMVESVPSRDSFSWTWLAHVGEKALNILANHVESDAPEIRVKVDGHRIQINKFVGTLTTDIDGLMTVVGEALQAHLRSGAAQSVEEYAQLFRTIGLPPIHRDYQKDETFAEMRVAGPNPVVLKRILATDERFPMTEAIYQSVMGDADSMEAAGAEGRLYLADYALLDHLEPSRFPDRQKYVYAPLALFAIDRKTGVLRPVAIQCKQTPAADNPIFTPAHGYNWLIAKTVVSIADGNHHEAVSHLGRTHLLMEPFVVATQRQLSLSHPLGILLRPHFEGTLAINSMAKNYLVSDQGPVDRIFGGTIKSTRELTARGVQSFPFMESTPPRLFRDHGTDDPALLPHYPYRDDALLYWDAIRRWTSDYIRLYYQTEADLIGDEELQAWFRELIADEGGRIPGLGRDGSIGSVEDLIDITTMIIFTSSVQHAAVNFPQYDLMSYVPNMPLAAYAPAPTTQTGATEADYLAMLPPHENASLQMGLGYLLGTHRYSVLGQYSSGYFRDEAVEAPMLQFNRRIADIGETIHKRNEKRRPYEFLVPSGVPQSINV